MLKKTSSECQLRAVLGPTNTGKTHYAMERMLAHRSGMIGFPLRLLARENYEKAIKIVGKSSVALITGEEKIIPENARFFCCTVESMPVEKKVSFLSVDEVQLAGDHERGHIFTDRLLNARGLEETVFLGSEIIKDLIKVLLPKCKIETRPRLSSLTYAGVKKITRLKPRSAIVAFSIQEIYKIAEIIRAQKGGAAVVMGALSPRTRNSQVDLYQSGEVDYLIATDAIGMGLNLDIDHVGFASNAKFDGNSIRLLLPNEIAQIAGRAGRSSKNGTFGIINESLVFEKKFIEMVENHEFPKLAKLSWRNSDLEFGSIKKLIDSLEKPSSSQFLRRKGNASDLVMLIEMSKNDEVKKYNFEEEIVLKLWEVCQIPDFANSFSDNHSNLLKKIFGFLIRGKIDDEWMKKEVTRLNRFDGEIDTLLNRIANIRTWTYITNKKYWINDNEFWQSETKSIEDKLSDELHERLTKRFVDKKIVMLSKGLRENLPLETKIKFDGTVLLEDQNVGYLKSFDFIPQIENSDHSSRLITIARKSLSKELDKRVNEFVSSSFEALKIDEHGNVLWLENPIAKLIKGNDIYNPSIKLNNFDLLSFDQAKRIEEKSIQSIKSLISSILNECIYLKDPKIKEQKSDNLIDEVNSNLKLIISSKIKAISYHVFEGLGSIEINKIPFSVKNFTEEEKKTIAKLGMRIGTEIIYLPNMLKPKAISLRSILWSVFNNFSIKNFPEPGRVNVLLNDNISNDFYKSIGFFPFKTLALRVDIFERLKAIIRNEAKENKFKINEAMLSIAGVTKEQMEEILIFLNYQLAEKLKPNNQETSELVFKKKKNKKHLKSYLGKNRKIKKENNILKKNNNNSPFEILKTLKI